TSTGPMTSAAALRLCAGYEFRGRGTRPRNETIYLTYTPSRSRGAHPRSSSRVYEVIAQIGVGGAAVDPDLRRVAAPQRGLPLEPAHAVVRVLHGGWIRRRRCSGRRSAIVGIFAGRVEFGRREVAGEARAAG